MFSSNQQLKISGGFEDLLNTLNFALELSEIEDMCTREDNPCKVCFQISKNNEYCIGTYLNKLPSGWKDFSFDYDCNLMNLSIIQFFYNKHVECEEYGDGTNEKGFLLENITYKDSENIENCWSGKIKISVFNNYYAK